MVNFRTNSLKKWDTLFCYMVIFFMAGVYVCKSKRVKNIQNYTSKKVLELGDVYKLRKKHI